VGHCGKGGISIGLGEETVHAAALYLLRPLPGEFTSCTPILSGGCSLYSGAGKEEGTMGEARDLLDRVTNAFFSSEWDTAAKLYAPDAVADTPDKGEVRGQENIVAWTRELIEAFPDAQYEPVNEYEVGNTAIDEGFFVGTNTGPLQGPTGETIPATGKRVRARAVDLATVENGVITSHRFYFDQLDFLGQLGLMEGTE
jgi:ketosteroid isomerase-like protein